MATSDKALVNKSMLIYYDGKIKNWTQLQISEKISALGDIFTLKGKVESTDALPAENNKAGDLYLVAVEGSNECAEYYWTGTAWEYMGVTGVSLDGYITETQLYKGVDGSGTLVSPAADTILSPIYKRHAESSVLILANEDAIKANTAAIAAINNAETGILKTAQNYADSVASSSIYGEGGSAEAPAAGSLSAKVKALEDATSDVITEEDIDGLFA